MQTPDEWLTEFESKVADLQEKATRFKENLESAGNVKRSADGTVSVTVAPNGALVDLQISDAAMTRSAAELTAEILGLTRAAREAAAGVVAESFVPLGGDRETVARIPAPPEPTPEQPPRRAPRPPVDDDEDFSDSTVVLKDVDSTW